VADSGKGVIAVRTAKAYFLKGSQYVRYDLAADEVEAGYPASIETEWNGLTPAEPRP
jgi:hypothetical protein